MQIQPITKGLSISLCVGKYGGFYSQFTPNFFRVCLGWIALTLWFIDLESFITHLRTKKKYEQTRNK